MLKATYICDRCGAETTTEFYSQLALTSLSDPTKHVDLCRTCRTAFELFMQMKR